MKTNLLGNSALGQPIWAHEFPGNGPKVLVLGGIHGDEYEGVAAADGLLALLKTHPLQHLHLTIVPRANPDGVLLKTRGNGNGVDLNRNLPTKDWSPEVKTPRYHPGPTAGSEPENKALISLLERLKPTWVVSLHSWHPVLNINGNCLPQAQAIAHLTGYKIDADIGYPTPGCLGTYAGIERNWPTLTYEIERGLGIDKILSIHTPAVMKALQLMEENL